jgi:hypothetical protein
MKSSKSSKRFAGIDLEDVDENSPRSDEVEDEKLLSYKELADAAGPICTAAGVWKSEKSSSSSSNKAVALAGALVPGGGGKIGAIVCVWVRGGGGKFNDVALRVGIAAGGLDGPEDMIAVTRRGGGRVPRVFVGALVFNACLVGCARALPTTGSDSLLTVAPLFSSSSKPQAEKSTSESTGDMVEGAGVGVGAEMLGASGGAKGFAGGGVKEDLAAGGGVNVPKFASSSLSRSPEAGPLCPLV